MIQRIQSIYLLLVAGISAALLASPIATLVTDESTFTLKAMGLFEIGNETVKTDTIPLAILISIFTLISFGSIFMYKKRMLQIRLNFFNMALQIGYVGLVLFYIFTFKNDLNADLSFSVTAVFPLVGAILTFLAIRAIGKDEALIRSVDRIR